LKQFCSQAFKGGISENSTKNDDCGKNGGISTSHFPHVRCGFFGMVLELISDISGDIRDDAEFPPIVLA